MRRDGHIRKFSIGGGCARAQAPSPDVPHTFRLSTYGCRRTRQQKVVATRSARVGRALYKVSLFSFLESHLPPRARAWLTRAPGSALRLKNAEHYLRLSPNQEYPRALLPCGLAFYFPLAQVHVTLSALFYTMLRLPPKFEQQKNPRNIVLPPFSRVALPPRETSCASTVAVTHEPRLPRGRSSPRRGPSASPMFS